MHAHEVNDVAKEATVFQWVVWTTSWDFKPVKKRWTGALLSVKCCCFVRKPLRRALN